MVFHNCMMGNWFQRFQGNVIKDIQTDRQEEEGREGQMQYLNQIRHSGKRSCNPVVAIARAEPLLMGVDNIYTHKKKLYMMCLYRHRCIMVLDLISLNGVFISLS